MIEMLNNSFTAERLGRNTLFPNINIKDTIEMNIIITRLKGLGISIADGFSSTTEQKDEQLKKDEYIAKICVYSGKSVPEDVDPKTTNMDGDTAMALSKQELKEVTEQYGGYEAWTAYAQSQGADGTMGWCWVYYTGQGAGSEESYAVYMKEGSARYGEVFHLGDYLPGGTLFTGYNMKEHGIADDREFQRMYENGEFGDGLTIDENGDIIIE